MADSLSSAPWDGSASRFTPQQWRASCLIDTGEGAPDAKDRYKLPVREPGGAYNRAAMGAAAAALAGGRGGVNVPASAKKSASTSQIRTSSRRRCASTACSR